MSGMHHLLACKREEGGEDSNKELREVRHFIKGVRMLVTEILHNMESLQENSSSNYRDSTCE